jgi:DNA processing protein
VEILLAAVLVFIHIPGMDENEDMIQVDYSEYLLKNHCKILDAGVLSAFGVSDELVFFKGNAELLNLPMASVVGTRSPTPAGVARAKKVVRVLVENGFCVMSGLAKGIDTAAHTHALELSGATIAVLGTPVHKIYPAENRGLYERIVERGLILSPAKPHEETGKFLFPRRNRLMARLSSATIVIEAGNTSGVVHQAAECLRQGRKLIFLKSLVDNPDLEWPAKFLKSGALVLETPEQLLEMLR